MQSWTRKIEARYSGIFLLCYWYPSSMCFYSESEYIWLTSIHSTSSYDLKPIIDDFLSGKMNRGINWELADLKEKLLVIRRLENELCSIRQRIDTEKNPVRKAKMLSVYGKMSRALTGKEM